MALPGFLAGRPADDGWQLRRVLAPLKAHAAEPASADAGLTPSLKGTPLQRVRLVLHMDPAAGGESLLQQCGHRKHRRLFADTIHFVPNACVQQSAAPLYLRALSRCLCAFELIVMRAVDYISPNDLALRRWALAPADAALLPGARYAIASWLLPGRAPDLLLWRSLAARAHRAAGYGSASSGLRSAPPRLLAHEAGPPLWPQAKKSAHSAAALTTESQAEGLNAGAPDTVAGKAAPDADVVVRAARLALAEALLEVGSKTHSALAPVLGIYA